MYNKRIKIQNRGLYFLRWKYFKFDIFHKPYDILQLYFCSKFYKIFNIHFSIRNFNSKNISIIVDMKFFTFVVVKSTNFYSNSVVMTHENRFSIMKVQIASANVIGGGCNFLSFLCADYLERPETFTEISRV